MNGSQMREIRRDLGMERLQFARALGYTGTDRNDATRIRKYESDKQQIPLYLAREAWMLRMLFRKLGRLPTFPAWTGYEFEHEPDTAHQGASSGAV